MKASIKFREEKKPIVRAKIPLTILNGQFQSGIIAGESKELSLNLSTLFQSGPSFKFSYRPNDSTNPFSLVFKTGIGHFGSPVSSPFTMSAQFNLIGNQNPTFFIHFKPNFGDFCFKKSHQSNGLAKHLAPVQNGSFDKIGGFPVESAVCGVVENLFSGTVVSARTMFPVKNRAVVNFRWGLRFPKGEAPMVEDSDTVVLGKTELPGGISFKHCPMLVMNKISVEHVVKDDSKKGTGSNADVAQACLDVKQQLEAIHAENGLLRNALNDLRSELALKKFSFSTSEAEKKYSGGGGRGDHRRGNGDKKSLNGKAVDGDVNEELKV